MVQSHTKKYRSKKLLKNLGPKDPLLMYEYFLNLTLIFGISVSVVKPDHLAQLL